MGAYYGQNYTWLFNKFTRHLPGNLRQVVTPDIVAEMRWFKSPYVGVVSFSVLKQMS